MTIRRVCQQCGAEFFIPPSQAKHRAAKYCSRKCYHLSRRVPRVDRTCKMCGKVFQRKESELKAGRGTYCSAACQQSDINKVTVKCDWCGTKIEDYPSQLENKERHFCNMECYGKWLSANVARGKDNPRWKPRVQKICATCGKSYEAEQWERSKRFCSKDCYVKWMCTRVGELSPGWRGGKSFEPYTPEFNNQFKKAIRERDEHACAICGREGNEVHHIDYDKQNTVPENCITLCKSCHAKTNGNRDQWQEYLGDLVSHRIGE